MPKKVKDGIVASLIIHKASEMTPKGKMAVAKWLKSCADNLMMEGYKYDKKFQANYRY